MQQALRHELPRPVTPLPFFGVTATAADRVRHLTATTCGTGRKLTPSQEYLCVRHAGLDTHPWTFRTEQGVTATCLLDVLDYSVQEVQKKLPRGVTRGTSFRQSVLTLAGRSRAGAPVLRLIPVGG
jgi:hypothetical protein